MPNRISHDVSLDCSNASRGARRFAGFTLVELLVVIGIIALLISILLPTLASARRSANSIKCLASLREIGNGFAMYAIDNHGYWPAARDRTNPKGGADNWHSWTDLIAKYMNGTRGMSNYIDIAQVRRRSVIWGCPEWTRSHDWDSTKADYLGENVYTGYGMQYYPTYWDDGHLSKNLANNSTVGDARSPYIKASVWQRPPSSDRLLIADSQFDIIWTSPDPWSNAMKFPPYDPAGFARPGISIDSRHMKPGTPKRAAINKKTVNVLFCDGHAAASSPREVWNAIHHPGQDSPLMDGAK